MNVPGKFWVKPASKVYFEKKADIIWRYKYKYI